MSCSNAKNVTLLIYNIFTLQLHLPSLLQFLPIGLTFSIPMQEKNIVDVTFLDEQHYKFAWHDSKNLACVDGT